VKVALVIGSLRRASMSRKLAQALAPIAPAAMQLHELDIGGQPLYNGDAEDSPAAEPWKRLREAVRASDAVLFIVPEYNRSIPGAVKNAIDVASKPTGQNCWVGKPAFVISQSTGPLGGLAGSFALKQTLAGAGAVTMPHPEVYLGRVATLFDAQGGLVPDTQEFLRGVLAAFETWIRHFPPRASA
jgi:chromate reductase, NAD(P)H dehydrogenase (quinone)